VFTHQQGEPQKESHQRSLLKVGHFLSAYMNKVVVAVVVAVK